jgi:uncharacterized protein
VVFCYNMNMKKGIIFLILTVILIVFSIFWFKNQEKTPKIDEKTNKIVKIGQISLKVDVAETEVQKEQGLSGRDQLEENEGMLFIFDNLGYYGIWMKDMNFPIDIAWLNQDKKIIYIENNVDPETYPKIFYALKDNIPVLNQYVIETSANFFIKAGIKIGDLAEF